MRHQNRIFSGRTYALNRLLLSLEKTQTQGVGIPGAEYNIGEAHVKQKLTLSENAINA